MPRPKQRTPELRDHVLSTAVNLLAREGVAGFTARNVAREAQTSTPALYELFGDKRGLLSEVFFEGFRLLADRLEWRAGSEDFRAGGIRRAGSEDRDANDIGANSNDPRADLLRLVANYRDFIRENPVLSQLMFSRPFTDFDAGESEREASGSVKIIVVERVRRCLDAGIIHGEATDIAHVLVALVQGLAAAENAVRLGSTRESIDRRWALAVDALLEGLSR